MIDSIGSCSSIAHEPAREKVAVACRLSDKTVRFMIAEENAKESDGLDAMDSVAAEVRAHADTLVMTTDDGAAVPEHGFDRHGDRDLS